MKCKYCDNDAKHKGMCWKHYGRVRNHGNPHVKYKQGVKILEVGFTPTDGIPWKPTGTKFCEWAYGR